MPLTAYKAPGFMSAHSRRVMHIECTVVCSKVPTCLLLCRVALNACMAADLDQHEFSQHQTCSPVSAFLLRSRLLSSLAAGV